VRIVEWMTIWHPRDSLQPASLKCMNSNFVENQKCQDFTLRPAFFATTDFARFVKLDFLEPVICFFCVEMECLSLTSFLFLKISCPILLTEPPILDPRCPIFNVREKVLLRFIGPCGDSGGTHAPWGDWPSSQRVFPPPNKPNQTKSSCPTVYLFLVVLFSPAMLTIA